MFLFLNVYIVLVIGITKCSDDYETITKSFFPILPKPCGNYCVFRYVLLGRDSGLISAMLLWFPNYQKWNDHWSLALKLIQIVFWGLGFVEKNENVYVHVPVLIFMNPRHGMHVDGMGAYAESKCYCQMDPWTTPKWSLL